MLSTLVRAIPLLISSPPAQDAARPVTIEGASDSIARASVTGPIFYPPESYVSIEDYHNPRMKRLREEYGLDKVVAGEKSEFRRILKLRNWVFSRWPIDNDQDFNGDAFAILEKAKTGAGFNCSHSLAVQHAVMVSMGFVARDMGVDRNVDDLGRSIHHGVNEVWSNDYAKWVLLDAKYDTHFERDGIPLSALEVHEGVRKDGGKGIVKVVGIDRTPTGPDPSDAPENSKLNYYWLSYYLRPNPFTEPHFSGSSRLLVFDNDGFRNTTWYRSNRGQKVKHWAYAANAWIPTKNPHEIEWTPGVPDVRIRQTGTNELDVRIRSATPNFKTYLIRLNDGPWRAISGDRFSWSLRPGENRFAVRSENVAGVKGPIVSAAVELKAP